MAWSRSALAALLTGRITAISPRKRYLLLTFALIALVAGLILFGWLRALFVILIGLMVFAPRLVEWVLRQGPESTCRKTLPGPWGPPE